MILQKEQKNNDQENKISSCQVQIQKYQQQNILDKLLKLEKAQEKKKIIQEEKEKEKTKEIIEKKVNKCWCCFLNFFYGLIFVAIIFIFISYLKRIEWPITTKIIYEFQWLSRSSIQYKTIEFMNEPLDSELTYSKFHKDSVYSKMKKHVLQSQYSKRKIWILTGKRSIGKSTSIRYIANQLISKGAPVFFIELEDSFSERNSQQIFYRKIVKNKMWNLIKNWNNSSNRQTKVVRFNQIFQQKFKNKTPVIIIDEINNLAQLYQPNKTPQIQFFYKSLINLKKRGATVLLVSSDPDFTYVSKMYSLRKQYYRFNQIQIQPNPNKDFNKMFQQYKINKKQRQQILKYYGQRGPIIEFLQQLNTFSQKNITKIIETKLNKIESQILDAITEIACLDLQNQKIIVQALMNICKQQNLNEFPTRNYYSPLGAKDILFNTRFKSRMRMKAFERYIKNSLNSTIKCKQPQILE